MDLHFYFYLFINTRTDEDCDIVNVDGTFILYRSEPIYFDLKSIHNSYIKEQVENGKTWLPLKEWLIATKGFTEIENTHIDWYEQRYQFSK